MGNKSKSPCYDCEYRDEDKNNERCACCERRLAYARGETMFLEWGFREEEAKPTACTACGGGPLYSRGLCRLCYQRWYWNEIRKTGKKLQERGLAIKTSGPRLKAMEQ